MRARWEPLGRRGHPGDRGRGALRGLDPQPRDVGMRVPRHDTSPALVNGQRLEWRAEPTQPACEGQRQWTDPECRTRRLSEIAAAQDKGAGEKSRPSLHVSTARKAARSSSTNSQRQAKATNATAAAPVTTTRGDGGRANAAPVIRTARASSAPSARRAPAPYQRAGGKRCARQRAIANSAASSVTRPVHASAAPVTPNSRTRNQAPTAYRKSSTT